MQRLLGDRTAAQAGDDGVVEDLDAVHRGADVGGQDAADADGKGLLQHHYALLAAESLAHGFEREGAEGDDAEDADLVAGFTHFVDGVLDRAEHRAHGDDDGVGVVHAVAADEAARVAAEERLELVAQLRNHFQRLHLLLVRQVAHFHEGFGADHGADRDGIVGVQHLARLVRRQEGVDLLLRRHVDALVGMGQDEAVHAHHHRHAQRFGELEGLDVQVEGFLVGLGENLDPAAVALRDRVGVVVPDVDRGAEGTVGDRHDDRQAEPGGVIDRLDHVQQALRGGGGVGARAGR